MGLELKHYCLPDIKKKTTHNGFGMIHRAGILCYEIRAKEHFATVEGNFVDVILDAQHTFCSHKEREPFACVRPASLADVRKLRGDETQTAAQNTRLCVI